MKRTLTVFAVVLLAFFCSCGANEQNRLESPAFGGSNQLVQPTSGVSPPSSGMEDGGTKNTISSEDMNEIADRDPFDYTGEEIMQVFLYFVDHGAEKLPFNMTDDEKYSAAQGMTFDVPNKDALTENDKWLYSDMYLCYQYSPFCGSQIEVVAIEPDIKPIHMNQYGCKVTLDIKEVDNPLLKPGVQDWYFGNGTNYIMSPFSGLPCGFLSYEKYEQMQAVDTSLPSVVQTHHYRNAASKFPFETINELPVDILTSYAIRSAREEDIVAQGYEFSLEDVASAVKKTVGDVNTDITTSIYYDETREAESAFYFDPSVFIYQGGANYQLLYYKEQDNHAYVWVDLYGGVWQTNSMYPFATFCLSFDIDYEIPHLLWVKEVTGTNAASFYINEEIKIP